MPARIQVGVHIGSGPESPPTIRLDVARAQFVPKGSSLIFNGTDPRIKRYQLSLLSEKALGDGGVMIRNWIRDHDGVGGCFVESRRLLVGIRYRSEPGFDPEAATYELLANLQDFLTEHVFSQDGVEFSFPQMLMYDDILNPVSCAS